MLFSWHYAQATHIRASATDLRGLHEMSRLFPYRDGRVAPVWSLSLVRNDGGEAKRLSRSAPLRIQFRAGAGSSQSICALMEKS
jgi:hypothetical protein